MSGWESIWKKGISISVKFVVSLATRSNMALIMLIPDSVANFSIMAWRMPASFSDLEISCHPRVKNRSWVEIGISFAHSWTLSRIAKPLRLLDDSNFLKSFHCWAVKQGSRSAGIRMRRQHRKLLQHILTRPGIPCRDRLIRSALGSRFCHLLKSESSPAVDSWDAVAVASRS